MSEEQISFDDLTAPHAYLQQQPSDTSAAAADDVKLRSGTQRWSVFMDIRNSGEGGQTDDELANHPGNGVKACSRRLELQEMGMVVDSGVRRLTKSHQKATVWVLTTKAHRWLADNVR